jgi:pilus assembly protein CpaF
MAILLIQDENGVERRADLRPLPFRIGKKSGRNALVLDHIGISREHCAIFKENDAFAIVDSGSRNGTYLNGRRLAGRETLRDRDVIRVGPFTLTFFEGEPAFAPSAGLRATADKPSAPAPSAALRAAAGRSAPAAGTSGHHTPVELKKKVHEEILATLDLKHTDLTEKSAEEVRAKATAAARAAVRKFDSERPAWLAADALVKEVVDEAVGLGPLEDFLADNSVDEIMVNGWERLYIERQGRIVLTDKQFTSNEQVLAVIRRILAPIGRRVDESSPMVDARLADGSRVNAIIPPLCLTGPTITIRKFARTPYTHLDLIRFGSITTAMADFLKLAVHNRRNIIISGGTGSGKTTFLNILSGYIPHTERIVTIEDAAELRLAQEHVVSLESKPASIEGKGEIPIRKLVINALRMRPDRIVVGECRGGEALDMLQAMNTGHDGSLTTLHANSPRDALARLETMVLMAGLDLPARAIREQTASAIHLIVQGARLVDGTRKITNISEITGMEGETITMQSIFEFTQSGFDEKGRVVGSLHATGAVPKFVHELRQRGIEVDMGLFRTEEEGG